MIIRERREAEREEGEENTRQDRDGRKWNVPTTTLTTMSPVRVPLWPQQKGVSGNMCGAEVKKIAPASAAATTNMVVPIKR